MATGKSSVGRALASRLRREFVDTDDLVERRFGKPVATVFAEHGEEVFREAEREAVAIAARSAETVIATGGGSLGDPENVAALRAAGPIVCLTASPEAILRRAGRAESRPLIAGRADPLQAIRALLSARAHLYELADFQLDTSTLTIEQVVDEICAALPSLWREILMRSSSAPES